VRRGLSTIIFVVAVASGGACGSQLSLNETLPSAVDGGTPEAGAPGDALDGATGLVEAGGDDAEAGGAPCPTCPRIVFVTTEAVQPKVDFVGLDGADARCQAEAQGPLPNKKFKAWLSLSGGLGAKDRLTHGGGPYVLPTAGGGQGAPVAASFDQLLLGSGLLALIDVNAAGLPVTSVQVWTSTQSDGTAEDDDCTGWTTNLGGVSGTVGSNDSTVAWTETNIPTRVECSNKAHFYCFEQ
jgi:hypothetical protein